MKHRAIFLAALATASAAGTAGLMLAGGSMAIVDVLRQAESHAAILAILFAAWAVVANCLVLPSGSLSLIAGGAALGAAAPALIWYAAQLVTAPLLYRFRPDRARIDGAVRRYLGVRAVRLLDRAAHDGVWTTATLRLTPVLPSAPAALIAAATGITLRDFLIGSALAGWLRPLYFASLGATAGSLARIGNAQASLSLATLWPLLAAAACAVLILAWRIAGNRRGAAPSAMAAPAAGEVREPVD